MRVGCAVAVGDGSLDVDEGVGGAVREGEKLPHEASEKPNWF
ncbi:hypothetical protein SAMN04487949_0887 [Halogranum gelatinilyticum]|uniref:Uncharacterized protein n=1 Tax=Halogranum gelatinilyticum TaxID=660521 RepID=A0A1G9QL81_9EURY|nr:hypothetical protein [Halogranum gelatinilyticum]SDM11055.1 hypothetical protein SAMN04487949_0887 [Halogranum gelatinilyticum]